MADSADIETALKTLISATFYPNGTASPSIIGSTVTIQRGWPTLPQIQAAVNAGSSVMGVHIEPGMSRDVTRYQRAWQYGTATPPTITATPTGWITTGWTVTFAGTVTAGHSVAVQYMGLWYVYVTVTGDTLATLAAAFAAMIDGATSAAGVLTLPPGVLLTTGIDYGSLTSNTGEPIVPITMDDSVPIDTDLGFQIGTGNGGQDVECRVVNGGSSSLEVTRQEAAFRISVWSPTEAIRDAVYGQLPTVIPYFGSRITMPDGSTATWMAQREGGSDDMPSRANMWRRDLLVTYQWAGLIQLTGGVVITVSGNLTEGDQNAPPVSVFDVLNPAQASNL
jgi:hypothetical protein